MYGAYLHGTVARYFQSMNVRESYAKKRITSLEELLSVGCVKVNLLLLIRGQEWEVHSQVSCIGLRRIILLVIRCHILVIICSYENYIVSFSSSIILTLGWLVLEGLHIKNTIK